MKNRAIKESFEAIKMKLLINDPVISKIVLRDPRYPNISNVKILPNDISLSDDDIDSLNEGETIKLSFEIDGTFKKSDGNATLNGWFTLNVIELNIRIEGIKLVVVSCNCYPSVRDKFDL